MKLAMRLIILTLMATIYGCSTQNTISIIHQPQKAKEPHSNQINSQPVFNESPRAAYPVKNEMMYIPSGTESTGPKVNQ